MKLKGSDGNVYEGQLVGGVYSVFAADGKNVGNFSNEADALKLGGYEVVTEAPTQEPVPQGDQLGAARPDVAAGDKSPEVVEDGKGDNVPENEVSKSAV